MPNYNIIIDSKFNPLSFDEMAAPYKMYKEEFDKQQAAFDELTAKASVWEGMANEEKDPIAYAQYKAYSDSLKSAANDLMTKGLAPGTRGTLMGLKGDYASFITPIETAFARRAQLDKEQRDQIAKDPTMMYERTAGEMSLDDFLLDPNASYGKSYSGNMLAERTKDIMANLAKAAREGEEGKEFLRTHLNDYLYQYVERTGFDPDVLYHVMMRDPNANTVVRNIVDKVVGSSGIGMLDYNDNPIGEGWGDVHTRRQAYDWAGLGLYSGISPEKNQFITDEIGKMEYENALKIQQAAAKNSGSGGLNGYIPSDLGAIANPIYESFAVNSPIKDGTAEHQMHMLKTYLNRNQKALYSATAGVNNYDADLVNAVIGKYQKDKIQTYKKLDELGTLKGGRDNPDKARDRVFDYIADMGIHSDDLNALKLMYSAATGRDAKTNVLKQYFDNADPETQLKLYFKTRTDGEKYNPKKLLSSMQGGNFGPYMQLVTTEYDIQDPVQAMQLAFNIANKSITSTSQNMFVNKQLEYSILDPKTNKVKERKQFNYPNNVSGTYELPDSLKLTQRHLGYDFGNYEDTEGVRKDIRKDYVHVFTLPSGTFGNVRSILDAIAGSNRGKLRMYEKNKEGKLVGKGDSDIEYLPSDVSSMRVEIHPEEGAFLAITQHSEKGDELYIKVPGSTGMAVENVLKDLDTTKKRYKAFIMYVNGWDRSSETTKLADEALSLGIVDETSYENYIVQSYNTVFQTILRQIGPKDIKAQEITPI